MHRDLQLHPASTDPGIAIEVAVIRSESGTLLLRYALSGAIAALDLPPFAEQGRGDDLWRRSCLEAFVRVAPDPGYREYNFAPSGRWAAYRFSDYRNGMTILDEGPTRMTTRRNTDTFTLFATLALTGLPEKSPWQLALNAVIEDTDGALSYWALAHPPGTPDFHHPDGFVLELPEPA